MTCCKNELLALGASKVPVKVSHIPNQVLTTFQSLLGSSSTK